MSLLVCFFASVQIVTEATGRANCCIRRGVRVTLSHLPAAPEFSRLGRVR